jgi:hypothetical protein
VGQGAEFLDLCGVDIHGAHADHHR